MSLFDPDQLYRLDSGLRSRSISFENPAGGKGEGGRASSPLGPGRKGDPARVIDSGETVLLADIEGPGTIRHIWATTRAIPEILRGALIRVYWDDQDHPSIEAPVGDFMGFAHGQSAGFQTALHAVGDSYGMNCFIPMPFTRRARVEICNESTKPMVWFYQIDYTLDDDHSEEVGRLHVLFQRENPTTAGEDFELMPYREGRGRYLGAVIGIRPDHGAWWGEGEIKIFMDGDRELATIVGTGSEDYVGLSWGIQQNPYLYLGANLVTNADASASGPVSMYRWHIPDPIYWNTDVRITIQQIGHEGPSPNLDVYKSNLFERQDDWSTCTFWYEATPSAVLPETTPAGERTANLLAGG